MTRGIWTRHVRRIFLAALGLLELNFTRKTANERQLGHIISRHRGSREELRRRSFVSERTRAGPTASHV